MTRTEYEGHLETIRNLFRSKNQQIERNMSLGGDVFVNVWLSADVLRHLNPRNRDTRRALEECPYAIVIKNVVAENALRLAASNPRDASELRNIAWRQAGHLSQALLKLVNFQGADPTLRVVLRRNRSDYEFYFICPFKIKRIRYAFKGCEWLKSEIPNETTSG